MTPDCDTVGINSDLYIYLFFFFLHLKWSFINGLFGIKGSSILISESRSNLDFHRQTPSLTYKIIRIIILSLLLSCSFHWFYLIALNFLNFFKVQVSDNLIFKKESSNKKVRKYFILNFNMLPIEICGR